MMWRYQTHPEYVGPMLRSYRSAFEHTRNGGLIRMSWGGRDLDFAGFRTEFCNALNRRINLKVAESPAWRKLDPMWQTECARDAQTIRDWYARRVRFYGLRTPEMRKRYAALIKDLRYDD